MASDGVYQGHRHLSLMVMGPGEVYRTGKDGARVVYRDGSSTAIPPRGRFTVTADVKRVEGRVYRVSRPVLMAETK